ncbi:SRPBCC family protein [Nocardiopsis sp. RSe5-2]|uniref:SRPBCC family protein n=1 Tax=Nocardiopsis endophytica TaxID=3018445 RepID=A0ABT4UAW4_9ACTN|nr:SRPBCC family protein [Nocardiopsis endophytica]MDA2813530.1 SRPBCC family protein [Nocardiopsis endophytica]
MGKTEFVIEPGRQDVVMERTFDAPREAVFRAMTDPELIPRWWGPAKYEVRVEQGDIRTGGAWRFLTSGDDGEFNFHGVFHEVSAPDRIVQTFEFEGAPGHVCLETVVLEDLGGSTRYRAVSVFQSVEDRDAMVADGMEEGSDEGLERLEELASEIARGA